MSPKVVRCGRDTPEVVSEVVTVERKGHAMVRMQE